MRFALFSLVRLAGLSFLGASLVAVTLGQIGARWVETRELESRRLLIIESHHLDLLPGEVGIIDASSPSITPWSIPDGHRLDLVACSPWRNLDGQSYLLGRWSRGQGERAERVSLEFGLGLMTYPEGNLVATLDLAHLPVGAPCWAPGTRGLAIFPAADGHLYRCDLDSESQAGLSNPQAKKLEFSSESELGSLQILEIHWPHDVLEPTRLLASAIDRRLAPGQRTSGCPSLWWLELDPDFETVIRAEPIFDPELKSPLIDHRRPYVLRSESSQAYLVFQERKPGEGVTLRSLELEIDSRTASAPLDPRNATQIAENCLSAPVVSSPDGRWLAFLVRESSDAVLRRHRLPAPQRAQVKPARSPFLGAD